MNIAVFPGSFNPLHTGHAMLASYVAQCVPEVDEVWMLVSPQNPLKADQEAVPPVDRLAPEADRLEMALQGMADVPGVRVSDFEFTLPRPSFTYRTLCGLQRAHPEHRLRLLIGSDNLLIFSKWRNSAEILREFTPIVYQRPDMPVDPASLPAGVTLLSDVPQALISSTFVRHGLAAGLDMKHFVPWRVYTYIMCNGLYGVSPTKEL